MVIILRDNPAQKQIDSLVSWLKEKNLDVHIGKGTGQTIIGLIGDTSKIDIDSIKTMDIVEDVKRIQAMIRARADEICRKYQLTDAESVKHFRAAIKDFFRLLRTGIGASAGGPYGNRGLHILYVYIPA